MGLALQVGRSNNVAFNLSPTVVEEEVSLTLDDDDLDDNENPNQQETIFNLDFEEIPNPHANIAKTVVISINLQFSLVKQRASLHKPIMTAMAEMTHITGKYDYCLFQQQYVFFSHVNN